MLLAQEEVLVAVEALAAGLHPVRVPVFPAPVRVPVPVVAELGAARKPATPAPYVQKFKRFNSYT
jgi:hypothetical protein